MHTTWPCNTHVVATLEHSSLIHLSNWPVMQCLQYMGVHASDAPPLLFHYNYLLFLAGTSDESVAYLEGKNPIEYRDFKKAIATAITSSFTQRNRNECDDLYNSLTPTVLINKEKFYVCLYDCNKDILLMSDPCYLVEYRGQRKFLSPSACLFLWIVVNHRYVFVCCVMCFVCLYLSEFTHHCFFASHQELYHACMVSFWSGDQG